MFRKNIALGIALAGGLACYAPPADAQIGNCVRVMLQYVGKPLARAAAKKGSEMLVDYFAAKLVIAPPAGRGDHDAHSLTERDVENLRTIYQENGRSDCELRQDLDRLVADSDYRLAPALNAGRSGSICTTLVGSCQVQVPSGNACFCYNDLGQVYAGFSE